MRSGVVFDRSLAMVFEPTLEHTLRGRLATLALYS